MLRKIVVPKAKQYLLDLPKEYLNREIEILVLPIDTEYEPDIFTMISEQ